MENLSERVISVIAEKLYLEKEDIKPESEFRDLGADSLDQVEIVMEIEKELNIAIPDSDWETIKTVGEAIEVAKKHVK